MVLKAWYVPIIVACVLIAVADSALRFVLHHHVGPLEIGSAIALLCATGLLFFSIRHTFGPSVLSHATVWFVTGFIGFEAIAWSSLWPPVIEGLACRVNVSAGLHKDAHVSLFYRGRQIAVPLGIGIERPVVVRYPDGPYAGNPYAYGGDCVYPVHTHDASGIVHVEAQTAAQTFTLGQLFSIWGQPLSREIAAGYQGTVRVFGWNADDARPRVQEFSESPRAVPLGNHDHDEVTVQVGPPWAALPRYTWVPQAPRARPQAARAIILAKGSIVGAAGAPAPQSRGVAHPYRSVLFAIIGVLVAIAVIEAVWRIHRHDHTAQSAL